MDDDRRSFFKQAGSVTAAVVAGAALVRDTAPAEAASAIGGRAYTAGRYGVELDGIMAGWISSTEGGSATSDVVTEKLGPDHIQHKHLAGVKYEDISVTTGTGMSKGFYEWIRETFDFKFARKDGAVVAADFKFNEVSRISFFHALISEVGFPALDASSKDAAKLTVKFSPEYTQMSFGGDGKIQSTALKQDRWVASNFKLEIDGLDTSRVNKIEALVVKQVVVDNPVGESRDYAPSTVYLDVPNLVVTFPESSAMDFYKWHEDFVIKGNDGQEQEKNGTLKFLSPNLQDAFFTLSFYNLGIFKLSPEPAVAGQDRIRRLKAEMYCEEIKFEYHGAANA